MWFIVKKTGPSSRYDKVHYGSHKMNAILCSLSNEDINSVFIDLKRCSWCIVKWREDSKQDNKNS